MIIFIYLSVTTLFGSAFIFYKLIKPLVQVEQKPEPIECQLAYAKAKACIEMESRHPDRFKYNP